MKTIKKICTGAAVIVAVAVLFGALRGHAKAVVDPGGGGSGDSFVFQDRANIIGTFKDGQKVTFTDVNPTDSDRNYVPLQGEFCKPDKGQFGITIARKAALTSPNISGQLVIGNTVGNNCNGTTQSISIQNPQNPVPVAAATFEWDTDNIVTFPNETARNLTFSKVDGAKVHDVYFSDKAAGNCPQNGAIVLTQGQNTGSYFILSSLPDGLPPNITSTSYTLLYNTGTVDSSKCYIAKQADVSNITISGTQGQPAQNTGAGGSGPTAAASGDTCTVSGWSLSWLICPVLEAANSLSNATISLFEKQLSFTIGDLSRNNGNDKVHLSWSLIRDISSALLVIIMLVMVISQAVGGGPFEAYTIRKMLPKLVVAIILMQLSWTLLSYVVNIFNDVGHGLKEILYLPFQPANLDDYGVLLHNAGIGNFQAGAFSWIALIGIGIGVAVALPAILGFAFAAVIADLVGLSTLIFRKIIILLALIISPVAILLWILPGTNRYFKLWWDNLLKALMMFPLVIGIVAAGRIFAYVIGTTGNGTFLNFFLVTVAFFAPLFILPKTFRWGGDAMKFIGDTAFKGAERYMIGKDSKPMKYFQNRQQGWTEHRRDMSKERYASGTGFDPKRFWRRPLDLARAGQLDPLRVGEQRTEASQAYVKQGEDVRAEKIGQAEAQLVRKRQRIRATGGNHDLYLQAEAQGWAMAIDDDGNFIDEEGHVIDQNGNRLITEGDRRGEIMRDEQGNVIRGAAPRKSSSFDWVEKWTDDQGVEHKQRHSERVDDAEHWTKLAALNQVGTLGAGTNWRYLEHLYDESRKGKSVNGLSPDDIRKYFDDNVDKIRGRLPHVYTGRANVADSSPESFAQMHGVEVESELNFLVDQIKNGKTPKDKDDAVKQLQMFSTNFNSALRDNTIRGKIELGALRAFKSLVDDNPDLMRDADAERIRMGLPSFDYGTDPAVVTQVLGEELSASISSAIGEDRGVVSVIQAPARAAQPGQVQQPQAQQQARSPGVQVGGVINITHEQDVLRQSVPVPAEMLNTPDSSGWAPRDYANAENQARDEFNHLRGLSARTPEQEQRFQYYRANFPNW
jgi:hypothetical protein